MSSEREVRRRVEQTRTKTVKPDPRQVSKPLSASVRSITRAVITEAKSQFHSRS
jgi:hypothetical protein